MRLEDLRHLNGPNVYTARPVSVARLELDELTCRETTGYPGFAGRLTAALPGLAGHHCAAGRPGGFLAAMSRGTYFGHVTEHVALELSALAGREVHLGKTLWAGADGRYDVVLECPADEPADSPVPAELLTAAIALVSDLLARRVPHFGAAVARISRLVEGERLGVSTAAIADAARRRGIPVRRTGSRSMLRLGYGCHRRLVCAALTEQTSAVGVDIASDKVLAKQLLADAGIPVPAGAIARSPQQAAELLELLGAPAVMKPVNGNHGAGVTPGVLTRAQAEAAYAKASAANPAVIVEEFIPGTDYRVLVIDGRVAAAAELRPASVTGDGISTIRQLVDQVNADPRRGDGHSRELTRITLDEAAASQLAEAGLQPGSVPAAGEIITLRKNANLSTGGTSRDVTDQLHEEVAQMCLRAAAVAGLDVCGVDVRLADISAPLSGGRWPQAAGHGAGPSGGGAAAGKDGQGSGHGAVLELNACPGLRMHLSPAEGQPRDVAGAIIDRLYPPGAPARIPVIAVTGTNGKTTTVRMIGHILRQAGLRAGMATTDGVYSAGQLVYEADASGPRSAEMVLDDPAAEAAVLETARGGILRQGLGYDMADVAVITNITADHLGTDGVDDLDELIISCVLRDGQLVETKHGSERVLAAVAELPGAFGGLAPHVVANALAAAAACRALGVSVKDIGQALATFTPVEANPGRGNLYRVSGSPVIVDYGHNAAALDATGAMISNVWGGQPVAAVTLPGDRRDDLLIETATAIAAWFGQVVVYEDEDKRGRRPGEMTELIVSALRRARPDIACVPADGPAQALHRAIVLAGGDAVLFLYEKLSAAKDALSAAGAQPAAAGTARSRSADGAATAGQ